MEPQVIPIPAPQAPTFDQPNFEAPGSPSRQDFFSRQDQPNFSSRGFDDSPQMFARGSFPEDVRHDGGFGMFGTLLLLALLFVMARFFFGNMRPAMLGHGPGRGWQGKSMRGWGQDNALELARMRFAKGELSSEEFEMIQRALKD
jgi:uncharacterized membrane protein